MDQITKIEHERLKAIEAAAKALVANIYCAGTFGIPTVDPADLKKLRRALKPVRQNECGFPPADAIGL